MAGTGPVQHDLLPLSKQNHYTAVTQQMKDPWGHAKHF